ncbi:MAG: hypothetical protein D6B25_08330 [Desulfobulbaceae bacterium]|nr:MAG: hypothetical protein D6B25_08330 [Desulfobulbaceae bacterium]
MKWLKLSMLGALIAIGGTSVAGAADAGKLVQQKVAKKNGLVMLGPQPEPPDKWAKSLSPGTKVGFNPQPEPPARNR